MKTKRLEKAVREETIKEQVQVRYLGALCDNHESRPRSRCHCMHGFSPKAALPLSALPGVYFWKGDLNWDDGLVGVKLVSTCLSRSIVWKDSFVSA